MEDNFSFTEESFRGQKFGKIDIYIDVTEEQHVENGGEGRVDENVENGDEGQSEQHVEKGVRAGWMRMWRLEMRAKVNSMWRRGVRAGWMRMWRMGMRAKVNRMGDGSEYEESDYKAEDEDIDPAEDDEEYDLNVDENVIEEEGIESGDIWDGNTRDGDSGDSDVICGGDMFDDAAVSDNEGHGGAVVFNPEVIFNPSFEIGMVFASKDEFRTAVQSHAINTKR
ncbi:hypothetical protein ACS0TY_014185 [Phlomoides rotata]